MNHKIPTLAAAICLVPLNLHAQTITFLDQATRTPIADVSITCLATGNTVLTKADGRADIAPLKGCDSIRIDHLSYTPVTMAWAALAAKPEVDLNYRVNMLREVVTSGSRFTEPKQDVPEQIDVLGRRELSKIVTLRKFAYICLESAIKCVSPPPPPNTPLQRGAGCLKGGNSAAGRRPRLHFQLRWPLHPPPVLVVGPLSMVLQNCKSAKVVTRTSSKQAISGDTPFAEVATYLFDRVCGAKGSNTKVT